jgi:hypothetical protein
MAKKLLVVVTLILVVTMTISACANVAPKSEPTVTQKPTASPAPTLTPTPKTFENMPAEEQVREFLEAGRELDTSLINSEQRKYFSSALVKELNAVRGAYPTTYNNEAYLDYSSLRMKHLTDGSTPEQQTFPLFLPVTIDKEGNLEVGNTDGSWATIAGSRGIDWDMIVIEADDPRIDWPLPRQDGEFHCGGLWLLDTQTEQQKRGVQIPVVLLDKNIGQIFLEGTTPTRKTSWGFHRFLTIITDSAGNPVAARNSIANWLSYCLMEEGSDASYSSHNMDSQKELELYMSNPANKEIIAMWVSMETNHVYYMGLGIDQEYTFSWNSKTDKWEGLAPLKDAYPILAGEKENELDLVLVQSRYWIKAKE